MDMGLVNSHIAHWMLQLAGSSIRNVSLGTPWTMDVCLMLFSCCHVLNAKDIL